MRVVSFKIDEPLLEALRWYARRNRLSVSEVIRSAVEEFLERRGVKVDRKPIAPGQVHGRGEVVELEL